MPSPSNSQLHIDRPLSNFATAYENHQLVGLSLCPEVPVSKSSDKFFKRNKRDQLQYQNPKISGLEVPPEIEQGWTLANFSCEDYGFTAKVANRDVQNADLPMTPEQDATMAATALLRLAQEVRVKDLISSSSNYAAGNTQTLSGSDRWNSSSGGDPFAVIDAAKASIYRGQNTRLVAWCGEQVWRVLRRHKAILDTIKGGATTGTPAVVMKQNFAQMIEVDEFVVGEAWHTTTNPGQAATYSRVWPNSFGILAVADAPTTRTLHFASTFAFGGLEVSSEFQTLPGKSGAYVYKCAHSTDELVVCDESGAIVVTPIG